MTETSIRPEEVRQFGAQATRWWDPKGPEAMLHKLNPVRLAYIRDWIDQHWSLDEHSRRPLEGKSALDVGCGAGLLAEPLARLGATVTAIDPAGELVPAAAGERAVAPPDRGANGFDDDGVAHDQVLSVSARVRPPESRTRSDIRQPSQVRQAVRVTSQRSGCVPE